LKIEDRLHNGASLIFDPHFRPLTFATLPLILQAGILGEDEIVVLYSLLHNMDKVSAIFRCHSPMMTLKNIKRRTLPQGAAVHA